MLTNLKQVHSVYLSSPLLCLEKRVLMLRHGLHQNGDLKISSKDEILLVITKKSLRSSRLLFGGVRALDGQGRCISYDKNRSHSGLLRFPKHEYFD